MDLGKYVNATRKRPVPLIFLWLLLGIFAAKGIATAVAFPPYSGHDEVAHYAYLKIFAEEHRVPVIPDIESWRIEYDELGSSFEWDRMPEELYKYAHEGGRITSYTTQDWYGGQSKPVWTVE